MRSDAWPRPVVHEFNACIPELGCPTAWRPPASEKLPEGDWLYEVKQVRYRALAFKDGKDVRLVSRNKKAFDYPQLHDALKKLPAERAILDGEIAALDQKGRSSFQLLQLFKSFGAFRYSITSSIALLRRQGPAQ